MYFNDIFDSIYFKICFCYSRYYHELLYIINERRLYKFEMEEISALSNPFEFKARHTHAYNSVFQSGPFESKMY